MLATRSIASLVIVWFVAFFVFACGGGQETVQHAKVKAGDMPEGEEWTGVYYSQTYGHLHLIERGGSANAKWRTVNGDAWGEMAGDVNGDLFRYEWTEHKIGMVGPSATSSGHGYFKYYASKNGVDPAEIKGEWGLGESDAGRTWTATKQPRMDPDPDSVEPDELERRGQGGGWDEGSQPKRSSEADAAFGTGEGSEGGEKEEEEEEEEPAPQTGPDSEY